MPNKDGLLNVVSKDDCRLLAAVTAACRFLPLVGRTVLKAGAGGRWGGGAALLRMAATAGVAEVATA